MNGSDFHTKCGGQGSTIIFIKYEYPYPPKPQVVGGFLDHSWNLEIDHIHSKEAFLLSLTQKIKCSIRQEEACMNSYKDTKVLEVEDFYPEAD